MANITIRNIPDEVFEQIKTLSSLERRSLNSELLVLIEKGAAQTVSELQKESAPVPRALQVKLWEKLAGTWKDDRDTAEIVADIYENRSMGRDIEL